MSHIAFIGLGAMGAPMAANLIKSGFEVIVHNRTRCKELPLAELGAERADSPAEAARNAKVIITMVSDVPDVQEVICGSGGVLDGASAGSMVIDMSTIGPSAAREVAASCAKSGIGFVDAPVSGGVWGAENASLSIMVGGDQGTVDEAMPVLQAMGKTIVRFGPVGSGQAAKLVNQAIGVGTLAAVAEGLSLASVLGLDQSRVIEAVSQGASGSWTLSNLGPRMVSGDFGSGFKVDLMTKDVGLIIQSAVEAGFETPVVRLVLQILQATRAKGRGGDATQSIITALEDLISKS